MAGAASRTYKMTGRSNTTTSTLGVMSCCSSVSSRHRTMPDLVTNLSFTLSDSVVDMVDSLERTIN